MQPKLRLIHYIKVTDETQDLVGGYSKGGTPLTIPNREVKPLSADGTASSCVGE